METRPRWVSITIYVTPGAWALRADFLAGMTASGRLPAHFAHPAAISVRPVAATMAAALAQVQPEAAPSPARYVRRRPADWRYGRARGRPRHAIARHPGGHDPVHPEPAPARWHGRHGDQLGPAAH